MKFLHARSLSLLPFVSVFFLLLTKWSLFYQQKSISLSAASTVCWTKRKPESTICHFNATVSVLLRKEKWDSFLSYTINTHTLFRFLSFSKQTHIHKINWKEERQPILRCKTISSGALSFLLSCLFSHKHPSIKIKLVQNSHTLLFPLDNNRKQNIIKS